jgi:hypothetical protein
VVRDPLSFVGKLEEISHLRIKGLAESVKVPWSVSQTAKRLCRHNFLFHLQVSRIGNIAPINVIWAERALHATPLLRLKG